jgi:hypothetical protein
VYDFLVLGLIPGTNIQIGFWASIGLMIGLVIAYKLYKKRLFGLIGAWWHRFDDEDASARKPLHASQLHRRLHQMAR